MMVRIRSNDRALARTGCCLRGPPRACGGRRRSPTDASRPRASRDGLVLLLGARPLAGERLGAAATALGLREAPRQRFAGGGRALRIVFRLEQLAQLIHLLARQVAQATQLALQLAAGRLALRGEQEPYHGPDAQTEQERPERGAPPPPPPPLLARSLAHLQVVRR